MRKPNAFRKVGIQGIADLRIRPVDRPGLAVEGDGWPHDAFSAIATTLIEHVSHFELGQLGRSHASTVEHTQERGAPCWRLSGHCCNFDSVPELPLFNHWCLGHL